MAYQSQHIDFYQQILSQLKQQKLLYACSCSRKKLADHSIYPGFCREADNPDHTSMALRLKTPDLTVEFEDILQGWVKQNLSVEHGDFIVRRRDEIIAYQFAVVIDDYRQEVTHIVRGADLLNSTPKQIYLQQLLHYPSLSYMHLPVIVDSQGKKLSKQNLSTPVDQSHPSSTMFSLLEALRQNPPAELKNASIQEQLEWAITHWRPEKLKNISNIPASVLLC